MGDGAAVHEVGLYPLTVEEYESAEVVAEDVEVEQFQEWGL